MSTKTKVVETILNRFVEQGLFDSPESALRELAQDYIVKQINRYQKIISDLERKYGLSYDQFTQYLAKRAASLQDPDLPPERLRILGQEVMREEEDALEWKIARDMLANWLGMKAEAEK
ncbi:MAG TPA: hypothetical protein EYP19_09540 [Desulfobacterales bacterium]|nr:hypothetical protein [Desulfobacterales bacterium]